MATYKLVGQRFARKYTADKTSPAYAAALDAQAIVANFCNVPWAEVLPKVSRFSYHTEEIVADGRTGLDENVVIRDQLDAAMFCAEHKGGMHRAYAQAACYRYIIPTAAQGASITSIKLNVSSDPYNSGGCRVSVFTNDTGIIPMNCNEVRTGSVYGEAVMPRTSSVVDGQTYWYAAGGNVTLTPSSAITMGKYMFVYIGLENYSITRGNWLEGSATLENLVEITTSADVSGWVDGATYDLSVENVYSSQDLVIIHQGLGAGFYQEAQVALGLEGTVCDDETDFRFNANNLAVASRQDHVSESTTSDNNPALHLLSRFEAGLLNPTSPMLGRELQLLGTIDQTQKLNKLAFNLSLEDVQWSDESVQCMRYFLTTAIWVLPTYIGKGFSAKYLSMSIRPAILMKYSADLPFPDWDTLITDDYKYNIWMKPGYVSDTGNIIKNPQIYKAQEAELDGWQLLYSAGPTSRALSSLDGWDMTSIISAWVFDNIDHVPLPTTIPEGAVSFLISVYSPPNKLSLNNLRDANTWKFPDSYRTSRSTPMPGVGYCGDGVITTFILHQ